MVAEPLSGRPGIVGKDVTISPPVPSRSEVHLWQARIDRTEEYPYALLSADEVDRADRTVLKERRNTFVAARGFLRKVLSLYLDIAPHDVEFVCSELGKPALCNASFKEPLYFNISHSREAVLVGISTVGELGVDIEYMRDRSSVDDIARKFYSLGEIDRLMNFSAMERKKKFYEYWTIKEAFTKALGMGLRMPLDSFEVELLSGGHASLLSYDSAVDISPSFTLKKLDPAPGYAGAVAVNGEVSSLRTFQLAE